MIRTKGTWHRRCSTSCTTYASHHVKIRKGPKYEKTNYLKPPNSYRVSYDLIRHIHENGKLPWSLAAGGVATPADAALMSYNWEQKESSADRGFSNQGNPQKRANAIVKAVTNYNDPKILAGVRSRWKPW